MTSKPEQKVLETLPKGAEIMNMVRIQMNFYPNPDELTANYCVYFLKFFLPEPSGPAKNKKTFKKWTDRLKKIRWEEQELMATCRFLKRL